MIGRSETYWQQRIHADRCSGGADLPPGGIPDDPVDLLENYRPTARCSAAARRPQHPDL
ncbi:MULTISPECIES: hypothetical protein [Rhodococcus]|nr:MULTISPECIES: hypothetical protein [Rhodococcus]EID75074.1 hypothetical protein W59_28395 [Rhodococcus opacus RKJ300 = JCM 13270]KAF0964833.1 hypothetical protein MLGJGCBP_02011 [Rhodococcus sp. T7]QQZ18614.1 hypothetical protein GO592_41515 [Rhodococcus sp. 21391]UOT07915.1 hypothetical protein MPY17_36520 [Rhodococcus opacus]